MRIPEDFLDGLPGGSHHAAEARRRSRFRSDPTEMLRERGAALTLADYPRKFRLEKATADFVHVHRSGDLRKFPSWYTGPKRDRSRHLEWWAERVARFLKRRRAAFAYASNHHNHSPSTLKQFPDIPRSAR